MILKVMVIPCRAEGVCVKCFSKIEKIIKYRREIDLIISQFQESMRRNTLKITPGSTAMIQRGLRSPEVSFYFHFVNLDRRRNENEKME